MTTLVTETESIEIPGWVRNLATFRRWAESDQFPEQGRIAFLKGNVWVDMSKEQLFTHNQLKNEISFVLTGLVKSGRHGMYFPDGVYLSNVFSDISVEPDGIFVSRRSLRTGRVELVEGVSGGYVELAGAPDLVLEVVSRASVHKDTVDLYEAYEQAGVSEYWLADARVDPLRFDIYLNTDKGFVVSRKQRGWMKSKVMQRSFQLTQKLDTLGHPEFTLAVR